MTNYQKKSYKLFVVWLLCYIVVLFGLPMICSMNQIAMETQLMTSMNLVITYVFLLGLLFLIYKTESVYWINGTSYEAATKATKEARKAFAMKHFVRFSVGAGVFFTYTFISSLFQLGIIGEIWVFLVTICASAFSTIKIKL